MGLDACLEDEFGSELGLFSDEGGVLAGAIASGDPGYPMLRFIDVEGVTTFNRLQLAAVIPELERLERGAAPAAKAALASVLQLARRAAAEPHLYLSFLGD